MTDLPDSPFPEEKNLTPDDPVPGGFINPPSSPTKPDELSWGDRLLKAGKPLSSKHKRFAELLAQGVSTDKIKEVLGYTDSWISILRSNSQILEEAARYRDRLFDKTVLENLQSLGPDAVSTVEEVLRSDSEKLSTRVDTARWLIEKLTGKARQEVEVAAGASLIQLLQKLDQLKSAPEGTEGREVLELAKAKRTEDDWMETWVTQNIPGVAGEKT